MSAQPLLRFIAAAFIAISVARAQPGSLSVNTSSREEVRQFYRSVYFASENVPMSWTGSYTAGGHGDISSAFKEATRLRINFFRALAGVPGNIAFDAAFSAKAQQTALMLSANAYSKVGSNVTITLSHNPPTSWTYYTADGAEGAAKSNIAYGNAGPDAVTAYMVDDGSNNTAVGHRRWLLLPQTQKMGTGDVPGDGTDERAAANAIWILDGNSGSPRPATRSAYVAYPAPGYTPYQLVWPRWSFAVAGADFSAATVTMTRNGFPVATAKETYAPGIAENTLVWSYDGLNPDLRTPHARPTADTTYTVNIGNVLIGGVASSFSYNVTVFDPDVVSSDAVATTVVTGDTPTAGVSSNYMVAVPPFSIQPTIEWRSATLASFTKTYNAEAGLDGLLATTSPGYAVVQSLATPTNSGSSYRLGHMAEKQRGSQYLELPETLFVLNANAAIIFESRLGLVTSVQTARVQISTDDGLSWIDLSTEAGTSAQSGPATPTQPAFTLRAVHLSKYVNRTIRVRFALTGDEGGVHFVPDATNLIGWFIDNIRVSDAQVATVSAATHVPGGGTMFAYTPAASGAYALQARVVMFGAYRNEWGPLARLTATGGVASDSYLFNLSVRSKAGTGAQTLIAGFVISGNSSKKLVVRGIGPTLTDFGVPGALADPKLEIHGSSVIGNDSWSNDNAEFTSVGGFPLTPGSKDAAIVTSLTARDYTAQVSGADGGTGVALVELYDASRGVGSKLINLSARTHVGVDADAVFVGFNISGSGKKRLLIRGVGPTLTTFNVPGVLENPIIELYDMRGEAPVLMTQNDDWSADSIREAGSLGFPLNAGSKDAALFVELNPGTYSVKVSGVDRTTGVALVEVYEVP